MPNPPHLPLGARVFAATSFAAFAGALFGLAEAARVLLGDRLYLSAAEAGLLLLGGALHVALIAAPAGLVSALLLREAPRVTGWIAGAVLVVGARLGVVWLTDPPPFVDPFPTQGSPVAWLGVMVALTAVGLLLRLLSFRVPALPGALSLVGLGAWVSAAWSPLPVPTGSLPADAPNILLVTFDTTRADRFGAYGNSTVDTRNFDLLARQGALFRNAAAVAPVTGPSHTSMLSGSGPWDHGVLLNGIPVPADRPLLAEILHDRGYRTGAFVSAYVLEGKLGFSRGFETYDDDFSFLPGQSRLLGPSVWAMVRRHADPDEVLERRGGDTVDAALAWLNEHDAGAEPWFLWVHLFDAHGPYAPPPPYDTRYYQGDPKDPAHTSMNSVKGVAAYLKASLAGITDVNYVLAQYDGEISYADAQLGRLMQAIPQDTLVMALADHGESLGEHDVWFNHGDDVYETSVHVPAAVRWTGKIPENRVVTPVFEGSDVAPTLLDLIGLRPPDTMTGRSARAAIDTGDIGLRTLARSMCFDRAANQEAREKGEATRPTFRMASVRTPTERYLRRERGGDESLFVLADDPLGVTNRVSEVASTLEGVERIEPFRADVAAMFSGDATSRSMEVELSEAERQRLEALGYMDPAQ